MDLTRQAQLAKASMIPTERKRSQLPVYDAFGPFPDETILSGVDRVLFFLGARRMQALFNLPTPSVDDFTTNSDCSITISAAPEHKPFSRCCTTLTESKCPTRSISVTKKCYCPHGTTISSALPVSGSTTRSLKRAHICETTCGDGPPRRLTGVLKRSFSLCSLACRKLKQNFIFASSKECPPQWLWTRLQCHADGSKVYEIYQDLNVLRAHPSRILTDLGSRIIFVVLPNGIIMPFEVVSCCK